MALFGTDIKVTPLAEGNAITVIQLQLYKLWPELVIETDKSGIFIYKTKESKLAWDRYGSTAMYADQMVSIVGTSHQAIITVDNVSEDIDKLISAIEDDGYTAEVMVEGLALAETAQ